MRKIWIVGAHGHVGSALMKLLDCREVEILATDKDEVDITRLDEVHSYLQINRPDVVINCAGLTDVIECELDADMAYLVNALGVRNLAQEAQEIGAILVQISTDDVFSQDGDIPYNEFDEAKPASVYGKSKYAGEKLVRELMTRYVIVRSSWVYGTGKDFVDYLLNTIGKEESVDVPENHFASPTSAKELAKVILRLIEAEAYGTYHVVCQGSCSRYEFACAILEFTGNQKELRVNPVVDESLERPHYSVLDNMMLRISGMEEPMEWTEALQEYLQETGGRE